jgi:hypothetical protein
MYTYLLALALPRESKFGRSKIFRSHFFKYLKNWRKYGNLEENIWTDSNETNCHHLLVICLLFSAYTYSWDYVYVISNKWRLNAFEWVECGKRLRAAKLSKALMLVYLEEQPNIYRVTGSWSWAKKKQKKANRTQWSSCILYTIARTSVLVRVVVYSPNCSWILMFMLSNIQIVRQSSRTTYSGLLYVLTSFASLAASKFFSISPLQRKKKLTWQLI